MAVHTPVSCSWWGPGRLFARSAMLGNAAILIAIGFSLLTDITYVPVTLGLWFGAAAIVGLAILTPLEE